MAENRLRKRFYGDSADIRMTMTTMMAVKDDSMILPIFTIHSLCQCPGSDVDCNHYWQCFERRLDGPWSPASAAGSTWDLALFATRRRFGVSPVRGPNCMEEQIQCLMLFSCDACLVWTSMVGNGGNRGKLLSETNTLRSDHF